MRQQNYVRRMLGSKVSCDAMHMWQSASELDIEQDTPRSGIVIWQAEHGLAGAVDARVCLDDVCERGRDAGQCAL